MLYYKDEKSSWMEIAFPVPEEKEYELSNLNKGSQYQLYMRAVSKRGTSDPSDVLTVRTECKSLRDYVGWRSVLPPTPSLPPPPPPHTHTR